MKIEVYKSERIPKVIFIIVFRLLRDAFEERRQQGLNFKCGQFPPKDVKAYMVGGIII